MTPRYLRSLILFSLSCIAFPLFSQSSKETIDALQKKFKDEKVASTSFQSVYDFVVQREELVVEEAETVKMIAFEPGAAGSREVFYNDNIEVTSGKLTGPKVNSALKVCGNYEVESIFYSDAKVCSYPYKFVYRGDEMTFTSSLRFTDARYLTRVLFHDELPVKTRILTFNIPSDVNVELVEKNFNGFNISKSVSDLSGTRSITYTMEDLNALKHEENSLGMLYYYPHIVVVTKDFRTKTGQKKVIGSAADLYGWYSTMVKQVKNDPAALKADVARLTSGAKTDDEKIKNIYYWVQDNIKYIAFEDGISGFRPEAAQNVLHNRYGDCKGMANLTKEMLRLAGFDARLTWIGTNRIPYTYELPSLAVDNHMICTVLIGERQYILDPTEKFIALGKHGERIQGKEMMIEDGERFIVKKVPVSGADQNLIVRKEELYLDGETLKGKGKVSIQGEALKSILYLSTNIRQENQKKLFDNIVVSDFGNADQVSVINAPQVDRDKSLDLEYTYGLANRVTSFDKDLYIEIDWTKNFRNLKMDSTRVSDYYFHRKIRNRVEKRFTIPAGYKVTHLPANIKNAHADFSFELFFEQKGNVLIYTNEISVNHGLVKRSDFKTWNAYIKQLTESYDDQVVLTKTN
jgi:hypothetical protein